MGPFKRVLSLCIAAVSLAAPVFAECPVPGDIVEGIAARDDSGGVTTFRRGAEPGEVLETTLFDDNSGFFLRSAGGLLVKESYDLANGAQVAETVTLTSLDDVGGAFPVAEGGHVELTGVETVPENGVETPLTVTIEAGIRRRVLYGDCAVSAVPVRLIYTYGDDADAGASVEYLDYLPEFGIALFLGTGELGQAPDIYRIVELFKAPPE
ncbi:hypothetical protein DYI42_21250 [Vannielia litorea]|nr:hypothetical protein [Vannielia litorea]